MDDSQAQANLAAAYAGLKGAQANYDLAVAGGPAESRLALAGQINGATLNLTDVQILSGLKAGQVVALGATNGQPLGDGLPVRVER